MKKHNLIMRNVPSLPPPITVPEEPGGVQPLSPSKAARKINSRVEPAQVVTHYAPAHVRETLAEIARHPEEERRSGKDRRKMCRRLETPEQLLLDTRTKTDRRHNNRRHDDPTTNIEEEV